MTIVCGRTQRGCDRLPLIRANGDEPIVRKESNVGETAKCRGRLAKYCVGRGLDMGCGDEKIVPSATGVDWRKTTAVDVVASVEDVTWLEDKSLDYIFSSHLLEHLPYPWRTLRLWLSKLKDGGYLVLYLPHRDRYREWNAEHFWNPSADIVTGMIEEAAGTSGRSVTVVHEALDWGHDRYSFDLVVQVRG